MSALQGVFSIVGAIAGRIVEPVIQLVVLHVGFVFQYKKKQKKLEVEIKNLEEQRKQIEEKVDEAITRGEEVDEPVSNWLAEVEERVQKIKDDNTINANMQCFKFSCPDYISRYQMSKEAENKMKEVKNLTQSGNFSIVAHPKPFAQELQFPSSSANYANFESRELVFNNIMVALQDSNVKMIGVYGTGGVGKTTMVEEIGKQVKNGLFDEVVVAVVSQDANVSNIQGQLADRLNLELKGETEVGKANQLWNRLNNGKKNLIILDDMWQELNLKTIGIPITDGNNCCKVVITSRIRGVLEKMHVDRYVPMQVLLEKEAWALFKMKAGNSVDSPELHDIADAVCKECGGLPVAILAVGAALKDKKKYVWEDVLDQFKDSMLKNIVGIDPKVYASLKLSYDRLESSDAKSCFLLCCFFPEDTNISIEVLARHCIARSLLGQNTNTLRRASRRVLAVVDILKDACLLLEGKYENFVKMHDVIRDVAVSIAKDDGKEILVKLGVKEWPEKDTCESYSAISLRFDNTLELPDYLLCPQLHTLSILSKRNISKYLLLNVPDRFFSGMEKLTILELNRICMLPPLSLANLVNLRMLWLHDCELGDIAILKDLNNDLEILSLRGSNIEVLPSEIGQLTHLRLLDLEKCYQLTVIPQGVISNLSRLEELYILDNLTPWEATRGNEERSKVNLDELGKLTQLTTLQIHIPNVMLLPKDSCLENLLKFKISMGKEYDFSRTYSKSCKLAGVTLMDKLIILLMRAEELHLEKIEGLQEVLHNRGEEGYLLERHGLNPSGFFNNLIELTIADCRLKYLFSLSCARGFPRLQTLQIIGCKMMEAIVGIEEEKDEDELSSQVINFSQLKYLRLKNLPKLISFYPKVEKMTASEGNSSSLAQSLFNEKVTFPALETLYIIGLTKITEIWDRKLLLLEFFRQLRDVDILRCEKLVNVGSFNMPRQLPKLEKLNVSFCRELKVIVLKNGGKEEEKAKNNNNTISFPQLTSLRLEDLQSLKSFFTSRSEAQSLFSQVTFPALKTLYIARLTKITEIWDTKLLPSESFRQLRHVDILRCEKLVNVGSSYMPRQLPKLQQLYVCFCQEMKVIVLNDWGEEEEKEENNNNTISFPQLTSLKLDELQSLESFFTSRFETQSLFTSQVTFPALKKLYITGLTKITEIWDRKLIPSESFRQLKDVDILHCEKLVNVGSSNIPRQLPKLKQLNVSFCRELKVIALKNMGEQEEKAENNNNTISFPQLTRLKLKDLQSLESFLTSRSETQSLFTSQVTFPALKTLHIDGLTKIIEIWDTKLLPSESFRQLRGVDILRCEKLVNVGSFYMPRQLPKLQQLNVRCCRELKVIVLKIGMEEEGKVENNNNTISFPKLRSLRLKDLQSLESFFTCKSETQSLFTSQVTFPALQKLYIIGLTKITEIWDRKLVPSESFRQLRDVDILCCEKLVNVGSSNMPQKLPKLEKLNVWFCRKLKAIVLKNGGEEEENAENDNNTISFPQLTSLTLEDLQSLKSFFTSRFETQSLFTSQVTFPALKKLYIDGLSKIIEIWDRKLLPSESFRQLRDVDILRCDKLVNVGSSYMPQQVPKLQQLNVRCCQELKVIILKNMGEEEEKAENNNNTISFPQLTSLKLEDLQSLESFFTSRSETQSLFTSQVTFPALETLYITGLTKITEIWHRNLVPSESFRQLRDLVILRCEKLVNVG
ncbi:unnamed protein product [Camellia sinensis]